MQSSPPQHHTVRITQIQHRRKPGVKARIAQFTPGCATQAIRLFCRRLSIAVIMISERCRGGQAGEAVAMQALHRPPFMVHGQQQFRAQALESGDQ